MHAGRGGERGDRDAEVRSVVVISTFYPPTALGGAEKSVQELCRALVARGVEVTVVSLQPAPVREPQRDDDNGVRIVRIPSRAAHGFFNDTKGAFTKAWWHAGELVRIGSWWRLRRVLREVRPDVVHLNNIAGLGWLAWLAARRYPSVQTARDYYLVCAHASGQHSRVACARSHLLCAVLKWPFTLGVLRPTALVGVSIHVVRRIGSGGVRGRRAVREAVYNAPNPHGRRDPTSSAFADDAVRTIGFLGRVSEDKGVSVLLEAVHRMRGSQAIDVRVVMGGGGLADYVDPLRRKYAEEFDGGVFRILGRVTPHELFSQADFVAVPTQWDEPFGRVCAEALIWGAPVVHSIIGGLPEVVDEFGGKSLGVAEHRSPEAWARALSRALQGEWDERARREPADPTSEYLELYRAVTDGHRATSTPREVPGLQTLSASSRN